MRLLRPNLVIQGIRSQVKVIKPSDGPQYDMRPSKHSGISKNRENPRARTMNLGCQRHDTFSAIQKTHPKAKPRQGLDSLDAPGLT
ncbi:hypothetical protein CCAE64S_01107 [Castellaniella caeni]